MKAGRLRHLATIETYTETRNEIGSVTMAWSEYAKAWCDISPISGNEKYVSAEKHATATHQVYIRFIDGVTPKMRLAARGRVFEIKAVLNVGEKDRMMQLIVEEQADD